MTNPSVAEVGDTILKACSGLESNSIVGISGRGGSGKSTAMEKLSCYIRSKSIPVLTLSVDDFVFPTAQRNRRQDIAEARYFDTYDFPTLIDSLVGTLRSQSAINMEVLQLDRTLDIQKLVSIAFEGPGVVIVEGVHLFRRAHSSSFDFKLWIDLSFDEGLKRALARIDHLGLNKTPSMIEEMYCNRSTPGYDLYVKLDDPAGQSDLVLNGDLPFD